MSGPEMNKEQKKVMACDNKSVGMLIRRGDEILLIERKKFPFGFAMPAGHVDDKGSFEDAAREEVEEEVGFKATALKQLKEGKKNNLCRRPGGSWHYWKVYEVEVEGNLSPSEEETKQVGWYSKEEIERLAERTEEYLAGNISEVEWEANPGLEIVGYEWFKELGII